MKWLIIYNGKRSPDENMAFDTRFLKEFTENSTPSPILHFYDWKGVCGTFGHFIKPLDHLNQKGIEKWDLRLERRPTGGGIVFHLCDLTFSVLMPSTNPFFSLNTLETYAFVNLAVVKAISKFMGNKIQPTLLPQEFNPLDDQCPHFCMAHPTKYDVMIDGRKVGGAAQRRTKFGYLHQGTIALKSPPDQFLQDVLRVDSFAMKGMQEHSYSLLGEEKCTDAQLEEAREELRQLLSDSFSSFIK